MLNYIKETSKNKKEYYIYNKIPVLMLQPISSNVDINNVIDILHSYIPKEFFEGIDGIYIGDFEDLKSRNIQALFKDDAIYLSTFKELEGVSDEIVARDILHELAHSLEDKYHNLIYDDGNIEAEYNGKKSKLYSICKHEGYHFPKELLFSDELVDELDTLLYKKIGYDNLSLMIPGLFLSPYSITSIREYFANGLEEYYLGEPDALQSVCPVLYKKIDSFEI